MIAFSLLPGIAETLSTGIFACVVDGVAAAIIAWALLMIFGTGDSRTRFAVWFSALAAILFLPLLSSFRSAPPRAGFGTAHPLITVSISCAVTIFAGWLIFATLGLVRVARGFVKLRGLRRSCRVVDITRLDPSLRNVIGESARAVKICVSDQLQVPTAIGFFSPVVILPSWALRELSAPELKPILLHELAHLSRWDDWTNLFQEVVQALIFFHPIVWWIANRLSLEREMACDDIVLSKSGDARAYAHSLLTVAEKSFARRGLSLAQAAVSRMRQTSLRVAKILDSKRPRATINGGLASAAAVTAALSILLALPKMPELIGFRVNPKELPASQAVQPTEGFRLASVANLSSAGLPPYIAHVAPSGRFQHPIRKTRETHMTQTTIPPVIEASFSKPESENYKTGVGTRRAVFVVMQTRRSNNLHSSFVIIDLWQITLYRTTSSNDPAPLEKI